jgi:DNA (cytosine-5)-methyltransferase 1
VKPRLLDLFCGAGGCAVGYARAGFEVVGVDIRPQPRYPFELHEADALAVMDFLLASPENEWRGYRLADFDAIHASPPCQAFTAMKTMYNAREHPDLLGPTRGHLLAAGLPYVIENVPGAPMLAPVVLCGSSLGLGVVAHDRELRRHRLFETTFPVLVPPCAHQRATIGIYGDHARDRRRTHGSRGVDFPDRDKIALAREALGMPWCETWTELTQAVPPAYTEHVGGYLLAEVNARARQVA